MPTNITFIHQNTKNCYLHLRALHIKREEAGSNFSFKVKRNRCGKKLKLIQS